MENVLKASITADISDYQRKLATVNRDTKQELQKTGKEFTTFGELAKEALQGIAAALTIQAISNLGRAILDTTAKFQKFEAVLKNTLGSDSEAQRALVQISDFASKTPFQVDELTNAFIKLANQGFKASTSELRSLGDLAASTGKSFDQLAEALIDAQVGEFERLKEFGVRARKEGDLVTFTFKGVETQVKNTDEAIRGYILGLGNAEGVTGAMAAISETLGGKLSNLQDNVEQLRLAIGNQTSGVFAASIDWLNEFISLATLASKSLTDIRKELILTGDAQIFDETRKEVDLLVKKLSETLPVQEAINRAIDLTQQSYRDLSDDITSKGLSGGLIAKQIRELEEYRAELLKVKDQNDKNNESNKETVVQLGLIGQKTKEINDLNKQKDLAKSQEEINILTGKINLLKEELALINAIANRANTPIDRGIDTSGLPSRDGNVGVKTPTLPGVFTGKTGTGGETEDAAEVLKRNLDEIDSKAKQVQESFSVLGSVISTVFKDNPALGQFVSSLAKFAGEIISRNFAIAKSNAIAGASTAGVAAGPAAPFVTPGLIAAAIAVVATAFSGIFKGSGGGSGGGSPQTFTNVPGREFGGSVIAGKPYIVGEKRPELFVPSTNGIIVPRIDNIGASSASGSAAMGGKLTVEVIGMIENDSIRLANKKGMQKVSRT